jgi:hypothetical protein
MPARKFAVSFEEDLAAEVANVAGGNVSAWLAQAARAQLRRIAMVKALTAYETKHGEITEEEMKKASRPWRR